MISRNYVEPGKRIGNIYYSKLMFHLTISNILFLLYFQRDFYVISTGLKKNIYVPCIILDQLCKISTNFSFTLNFDSNQNI